MTDGDEKFDGVEFMHKLTGLDKIDIKKLWEDAKANRAALDRCPLHQFVAVEGSGLRKDYKCTNCGGKANHTAVLWYELGRKHARSEKL